VEYADSPYLTGVLCNFSVHIISVTKSNKNCIISSTGIS
jgi:hypothetical protein